MLVEARRWLALVAAPVLILLGGGCRGASADAPVSGHHELCCKAAMPDNISFVGCRATGYCLAGEEVWVRGPVSCTSEGPEDCGGGRCCKLVVDASEFDQGAQLSSDQLEPGPEPAPEPTAEPAPVIPVPLSYRAEPKAKSVPILVCPATLERGVVGRVLLTIEVDVAGKVRAVQIREGLDRECDALARDALLNASFEPARTPDGEAFASSMTWSYSFGER